MQIRGNGLDIGENMKYKIHSFTFDDDYFALIDTISEKDKKEILCAIVDFMFKGIEPNLDGHNRAIFNTLSRQLNKSKNKSYFLCYW